MLVGDKVILDAVEPEDLEWMRYHRNRPELRQYFREVKDLSPIHQEKWYSERANNTNPAHVYFKIMIKHDKQPGNKWDASKLIGCCGLTYINWVIRRAELSVFVTPEVQGNGYAKEALILMYNYAFDELNLHNMIAEVYDNNPALDFYKTVLGMKEDGIVRHTYFWNGQYHNSHMLSLLEEEWSTFKKTRGYK